MPKQAMIDYMKKEKFSNIYTPENAVRLITPYVGVNYRIWECTDFGKSNITKVFKEQGNTVYGTDIEKGFDFLTDEPEEDFDIIITNPPYDLKDKFIERCLYFSKPFALLLPTTSLEGIKRHGLWERAGISVIIPDRRIEFTKGSVWFHTSWFVSGIIPSFRIEFVELKK